jgi:hypothetical protein
LVQIQAAHLPQRSAIAGSDGQRAGVCTVAKAAAKANSKPEKKPASEAPLLIQVLHSHLIMWMHVGKVSTPALLAPAS